MPAITQSKTREIISDFADEIAKRKRKTAKPSKIVINFRSELLDNFERDILRCQLIFSGLERRMAGLLQMSMTTRVHTAFLMKEAKRPKVYLENI